MRKFLLAAALAGAPAAHAHAILTGGTPAPGAKVPVGPLAIALQFNTRIDAGRSRVVLLHGDDEPVVVDLDPDPEPGFLTAKASLAPGQYLLKWQVLAVDGHITRGVVVFDAGAP